MCASAAHVSRIHWNQDTRQKCRRSDAICKELSQHSKVRKLGQLSGGVHRAPRPGTKTACPALLHESPQSSSNLEICHVLPKSSSAQGRLTVSASGSHCSAK